MNYDALMYVDEIEIANTNDGMYNTINSTI